MYHKNYEYETTDPNLEDNAYDDEAYQELDHFGEHIAPYHSHIDETAEDDNNLEDSFNETLNPDNPHLTDQFEDEGLSQEAEADYFDDPEN